MNFPSFSKILNVALLILFLGILVNCVILYFHLTSDFGKSIALHKKLGWSFLFLSLVHAVLHFNYYKCIFMKDDNRN